MKQLVKFSLVGGINTLLHVAVFYVVYALLGADPILASVMGFCVAVVNSYVMNKYWTFQSSGRNITQEFARFLVVSLLALLVNVVCMMVLIDEWLFDPLIAQLLTVVITLLVNFTGNKYWSFKST